MKLITKAIEKAAPALDSQDPHNPKIVCKFFNPTGRYTFYMVAYDPKERTAYGYAVSSSGPYDDEWGYTSVTELEATKLPFGLKIERDLHFPINKKRVSDYDYMESPPKYIGDWMADPPPA